MDSKVRNTENCQHLWQLELKSLQWAAEAMLAKSNVICSQSPVTLASLWSHLSQVRWLNVYLFLIKESQRSGILGNIVLGYQMNQVFWWQNKNTKSYRCILLSSRVRAGFVLLPPPSIVSVCVCVWGSLVSNLGLSYLCWTNTADIIRCIYLYTFEFHAKF